MLAAYVNLEKLFDSVHCEADIYDELCERDSQKHCLLLVHIIHTLNNISGEVHPVPCQSEECDVTRGRCLM